jgi:hypothetical protein
MSLVRVLGIIVGAQWFFLLSCTTGAVVGTEIVAKLDERDVQKGDTVHSLFKVAAEPGEEGKSFRVLQMDQVQSYLTEGEKASTEAPLTFRMSHPAGTIDLAGSTFTYRVLEDSDQTQLIELVEKYKDGDNTIWSRYRATNTMVTPVSSRMFYFGYMFKALPYAFGAALLLYGTGRALRRMSAASEVPEKSASV